MWQSVDSKTGKAWAVASRTGGGTDGEKVPEAGIGAQHTPSRTGSGLELQGPGYGADNFDQRGI